MSCNQQKTTLTFDEIVKGWTSFHSFSPNCMIGMNNFFFSFDNGDLFIHNSDNVPRNTFYGAQYPTKVSVMVNDSPSEIKEIKAISLEGNASWDTLITAYITGLDDFTSSHVGAVEFVKKEGIWYAYTRRDENPANFDSKATYGIGVVTSILASDVGITGDTSSSLTVGDTIIRGSDLTVIGLIDAIDVNGGVTTLTLSSATSLVVGDFIVGKKDSRVEGANLRGYTLRADLEIQQDSKVELFSVDCEVIKSFNS